MNTHTFLPGRQVVPIVASCMIIVVLAFSTACKKEEKEAVGPQQQAAAGEQGYQFKITVKDMTFNWRPAGSTLQVMVRAKTTGWTGVGFNATEGMKDAWFIMGYVKDGAATIVEQHGNTPKTHLKKSDLGGASSVSNASGSVNNNETVLRFTIPLKPADIDTPINAVGDTTVLLAYGKTEQMAQVHAFRAKLSVNLSTGAYSVITAK